MSYISPTIPVNPRKVPSVIVETYLVDLFVHSCKRVDFSTCFRLVFEREKNLLGFVDLNGGIMVDPFKVESILHMPPLC